MRILSQSRTFVPILALGLGILPPAARASIISVTNLTGNPRPSHGGKRLPDEPRPPNAVIFN